MNINSLLGNYHIKYEDYKTIVFEVMLSGSNSVFCSGDYGYCLNSSIFINYLQSHSNDKKCTSNHFHVDDKTFEIIEKLRKGDDTLLKESYQIFTEEIESYAFFINKVILKNADISIKHNIEISNDLGLLLLNYLRF